MEIFGYEIWMVLLICLGVFAAGFVDAIGGGGGIISLPMYLFAGLPTHFALGTNKLSACIGTVASTARYIRNGFVRWDLAIPSILLSMTGSHFGTRLQLMIPETYLQYTLLAVLPVVAFVLLRQRTLPETEGQMPLWRRQCIIWGASAIIGVYDGFYGPGTGTFLLLVFCGLGKMDLRSASGNVKLVNLGSNIAALITSLTAGKVLIPLGLLAALFSIAGQYLGAGLALKNGSRIVRPVIITVLILLTGKIIAEVFL